MGTEMEVLFCHSEQSEESPSRQEILRRVAPQNDSEKATLTPIKAIRAKCLDCSAGLKSEVKHCPMHACPLYPFRMGHNPRIGRRELSDEQREALRERMKAGREKRKEAKNA